MLESWDHYESSCTWTVPLITISRKELGRYIPFFLEIDYIAFKCHRAERQKLLLNFNYFVHVWKQSICSILKFLLSSFYHQIQRGTFKRWESKIIAYVKALICQLKIFSFLHPRQNWWFCQNNLRTRHFIGYDTGTVRLCYHTYKNNSQSMQAMIPSLEGHSIYLQNCAEDSPLYCAYCC